MSAIDPKRSRVGRFDSTGVGSVLRQNEFSVAGGGGADVWQDSTRVG